MAARASVLVISGALLASSAHADATRTAGDVGAVALPTAALAGTAVAKDGRGFAQLAEAYGSAMTVVYILKPIVDRTRPDGGSQSFPSAHAASAFAGAAFLQRRYGWAYGGPAYAVATFVAYSRVEARRHYTTDVIAGGAIGVAANLVFTHRLKHVSLGADLRRGHAGPVLTIAW